jgi:lipid-binding SYLF domain-containing protein
MQIAFKNSLVRHAQRSMAASLGLALTILLLCTPGISLADTAYQINRDANLALKRLYQTTPEAKKLAARAKGILVFPEIIKAGLLIGGQYGEGVLRVGGKTTGFYRSIAASYGLQAGAQSFSYALFFLDNESLQYLIDSDGWEIGVGPSVVIVDEGIARSFTTTTAQSGIYAFIFAQEGLMAGLGIQGSKISQFQPNK